MVKQEVNELANDGYRYTSKDICKICNVNEITLKRFNEKLTSITDDTTQFIKKGGYHNSQYFYSEKALKAFQAWLLKNQSNQGRSSNTVKQTATDMIHNSLVTQELICSGNVEAIQEYCNMIMETTKVINNQNKKLIEQQPKVEFADTVMKSNDTIDMAEVAKTLNCGIGRNKLFRFLRDKKVLNGCNIPYQQYVDAGYFKVVESHYTAQDKVRVALKTVVFQRGLNYIRKLLRDYSE